MWKTRAMTKMPTDAVGNTCGLEDNANLAETNSTDIQVAPSGLRGKSITGTKGTRNIVCEFEELAEERKKRKAFGNDDATMKVL
jgi:hypothetical protein